MCYVPFVEVITVFIIHKDTFRAELDTQVLSRQIGF